VSTVSSAWERQEFIISKIFIVDRQTSAEMFTS